MAELLNQPFVSEAYDRLMTAQRKAAADRPDSVMLAVEDALTSPIADLKAIRDKLGLTQAQLSERLGMDGARISQMENGKPIPAHVDLAMRCLLALEAIG